ncbi:MAG: biotin/lipoyl-binding protein, partial [Burkholderiaceae bacterium]
MPAKHRWKVLASLLGLLLAGLFFFNAWQGPQLAAQRVVRRDFVQSLVGSGRVETPHRVDIGAQITATVGRVPVAEGQRVKAGDVLIELVATELRAAQRQAEVAVSLAQARLRQMREVQAVMAQQALRQARANLEHAQA